MLNFKKECIFLITRIILTTTFLIFSTYIWFNLKEFKIYQTSTNANLIVSENINFSALKQVSDTDISNLEEYNFQITSNQETKQDIKIAIVPDIRNNNVSNNYLKYILNDGEIHSLNMDGVIYLDDIEKSEIKNISLKIWISDTYDGLLNYQGRIVVS